MNNRRKRLLAVASAGGHWVQLMRLYPAMKGCDITFVTTNAGLRDMTNLHRFICVSDANIWNRMAMLKLAAQIFFVVIRTRPHVVITTGAAPGFFAIMFGRIFGARTIWIDSIANSEELSLAGKKAGRWAHYWLTQWPALARSEGPEFRGSVL